MSRLVRNTLAALALLAAGVAGQAGGPHQQPQPAANRAAERMALLAQGEAALARGDVAAAEPAFDRAAMIAHAADTELGLMRTYMQAGQYRRALAFGSHTAGAHLDEAGGAAMYAWLLHLGAQEAVARRVLAQARERAPAHPLLREVGIQFANAVPHAGATMRMAPARLAPHALGARLPASAAVVSSGVLLGDGRHAVVPSAALAGMSRHWVRNGLGQATVAQPVMRSRGLALLRLSHPLPASGLEAAAGEPFPGSVVFSAHYAAPADAAAAWPAMRMGFVGAASPDGQRRALESATPAGALHGGPAFDSAGRLTGVTLGGRAGTWLVTMGHLRPLLGHYRGLPVPLSTRSEKLAPEAVYERALLACLQFIAAP